MTKHHIKMFADSTSVASDWVKKQPLATLGLSLFVLAGAFVFQKIFYRLYLHPLASFPGPNAAAATTQWKAFIECLLNKSFCHVLEELHAQYGKPL